MSLNLRTDYAEGQFSGEKKYTLNYVSGDIAEFTDVTVYTPSSGGDYIGAADINITNAAINNLANLFAGWIGSYTALPTNFQNATHSGKKKYQIASVGSNVTLTDVTAYSQSGSPYQASHINDANTLINRISSVYDDEIAQIKQLLQTKGATSTDNLINAITSMVSACENNGKNGATQAVKTNPSIAQAHSKTEYDTVTANNAAMLTKMRSVKASITTYQNTFITTGNSDVSQGNTLNNKIMEIVGGEAAQAASASADEIVNGGITLKVNENTLVGGYDDKCAAFIAALNK